MPSIEYSLASQGGSVVATNEYPGGGYEAANLIDGNDANIWHSSGGFPCTVEITLPFPVLVDQIYLGFVSNQTRSYLLQAFVGGSWVTKETVTAATETSHTLNPTAFVTTKVRYVVSADDYTIARMLNFKVFGTPAPDTDPPSDVTGLTATKISNSRIDIDSDTATDADSSIGGYQTQVSADGGSTWTTLSSTSKSFSFVLGNTGFPTGIGTHSLTFRRKAYDTAGTPNYSTNWSNIPSAVSITISAPGTVTGLSATNPSPTQINLDFDDATPGSFSLADYRIFYNTSNSHSGESSSDVGGTTSAKNITGLAPGQDYFWWVKAKDDQGNYSGSYSSVLQKSTKPRIDTVSLNNAIVGTPFSQTITKTSAQAGTFSLSDQPSGMSIDATTGAITWGTATPEGTISGIKVRFTVTGSGLYDEKTFSLTVTTIQLESEYSPDTGLEAPVLIVFTDISDGEVTNQKIKFGDFGERTQADDSDFTHTYLAPGTYKFERWAKISGFPAYETYDIIIGGDPPTPPSLAIEFDEIELNRFYSEGATGGPEYSTSILGNPLGVQQRNSNRPMGLHEFELNFEGLRYDENAEENFDEFLDFFHTRAGQAIGFRFFPFLDNRWNNELIALTATDNDTYNLIRTYSKAGRTKVRRIFKPVPDLLVTIDDNPASDYSAYEINYTEGRIVFETPGDLPVNGELRVTGYYCIPVVFAVDKMNAAGFATYADLSGLRVIELTGKALGITD